MHAALLLAALAAGALGAPLAALAPREVVVDTVYKTVYVTLPPGQSPPTPAPVPEGDGSPAGQVQRKYGRPGGRRQGPWGGNPPAPSTPTPSPAPVAQDPPVESPPAESPPAENPPAENPPAENPPSSGGSTESTGSDSANTTSGGGADGSPETNGVSWLSIVNKYRKGYGLNTLTWSATNAAHATQQVTQDKGILGGGRPADQAHQVMGNNEGQVLAGGFQGTRPGMQGYTDFELAVVSWLCEVKGGFVSTPVDMCAIMEQTVRMKYTIDPKTGKQQTGHYDILTSPKATSIGCAFAAAEQQDGGQGGTSGEWGCNLSMKFN